MSLLLLSVLLSIAAASAQYTPAAGQIYVNNGTFSGILGDWPWWGLTNNAPDGKPGPTPAQNNATVSAAATALLMKYDHFIIIQNNQESFDALFGAYPGTNNIARATANANTGATPNIPADRTTQGYNQQINKPTNFGTNYPLTSNSVYTFTADTSHSPLNSLNTSGFSSIPQGPFLFNTLYNITTNGSSLNHTVEANPPHEFWATIYKINGGAMNGFGWSTGKSGALTMGYWNLTGSFLFQIASQFTLFDQFFESAFGGPLLNHIYSIGGRSQPVPTVPGGTVPFQGNLSFLQSDGTPAYNNISNVDGSVFSLTNYGYFTYPNYFFDFFNYLTSNIHSLYFCGPPYANPFADSSVPGVAPANLVDQLYAANVPWGYYADDWALEDNDLTAASPCKTGADSKLSANMVPLVRYNRFQPYLNYQPGVPNVGWNSSLFDSSVFYQKLQSNTLENVTWFQPDKTGDWGFSDIDPAKSDAYLRNLITSIMQSPVYLTNRTMIIVTWTEANGVYDHVPPYLGDRFGPGLRVPTIVISPDHAGGKVNSNPYEHYSFIKMIQRRFGLLGNGVNPLLGVNRDISTRDLTLSLTDLNPTVSLSSSSSTGGSLSSISATPVASSTGNGESAQAHISTVLYVCLAAMALMTLLI